MVSMADKTNGTEATTTQKKQNQRQGSLARRILIGLALGILCGITFGEHVGFLKAVGQVYVGLLQMSILPYMVVSLICGIGQLNYERAGRLAITGGLVLLGSWLLSFCFVFVLPLTFPATEGGSFFSPSLVQTAEVDFIDLYVPVNPFSSLARTVVPAAAVFSVVLGVALIGIQKKKVVTDLLSAISDMLTRVAMMMVQLTPFGVFAISANAAGTMSFSEIGRLQPYIVTFILATCLLTFWVLPGITAVLTPFSFRQILSTARAALVTGFVTGNLFIVLPLLVDSAKRLFEEQAEKDPRTDGFVEVLVPTSFNFPNIGKLITLLFVLFACWYTGRELALTEYPTFALLGLFTLFGGIDLAIPFLLDQLRIPSDLYQLYVVTGIVNAWFATLLAVMNLFTFTIIATVLATGRLQFSWQRVARFALITVILTGGSILGTRLFLSLTAGKDDLQRETLLHMAIADPVPTTVHLEAVSAPKRSLVDRPRLPQIMERGSILVGYPHGGLPFAFFNEKKELVGFDVELIGELARELGVSLELVPWQYDTAGEQLNRGEFDIAIGGLIMSTDRLAHVAFSAPYMTITASLVVKDHLRNAFKSWDDIVAASGFRIGVVGAGRTIALRRLLPVGDVRQLNSFEDFFQGATDLDALFVSAETGSAWTILKPEYAVLIPTPHRKAPVAFVMAKGDPEFVNFLSHWITLKKTDGTVERLYDAWILGKSETSKKPRWSIIRAVFGKSE